MKIKGVKRISACGVIAEWKLAKDKRNLKVSGLLFTAADLSVMGDWIAENELVTVSIKATDSKLDLSPIKGAAHLIGLDIRPKDHRPKFKDLVLTEVDPATLQAMIAAETDVTLTLMLVQNRLTVEEDDEA